MLIGTAKAVPFHEPLPERLEPCPSTLSLIGRFANDERPMTNG
jgi:hypothetical protein